jgi:Flp pilus assembly protein TadG
LTKHFNNHFPEILAGRNCCRPEDLPMSLPAASTASVRKALRRFRRNRRGSAAVEFALVAPVFFALLFAILETAIIFFAAQVLETMTQTSARYILTGQAQNQGFKAADFKTYVCNQIPALFTCANVYVDVQSYPAFSNITINSQIDAASNFVAPVCKGRLLQRGADRGERRVEVCAHGLNSENDHD